MKFVIEHLDGRLYKWCELEYTHISQVLGNENIIFTNVSGPKAKEILSKLGTVKKESVTKLNLPNSCILDPKSKEELTVKDNSFDYLIFGGVLGDYPPRGRTEGALTKKLKIPTRNLGNKQMSTDTAVIVSSMILSDKKIEFIDDPDIELNPGEALNLPYRYVKKDGKPMFPPGFMEFIRKRRGF